MYVSKLAPFLRNKLWKIVNLTCNRRTTEVNTNRRLHASFQTAKVCPVKNTITHSFEKTSKVGSAELCPRLELSKGIHLSTHAVQNNILGSVHVQFLSEVGVNLEELEARASGNASCLVGLLFEGREQRLEPLKGTGILANPDELHTTKTSGRVRRVSEMPDVLQDGSPGSDTNTSTDKNSDFVFKDIFSRSSIRSIDSKSRHLLTVLQSDLVHAHRIDAVVELGLSSTSTKGISQLTSEVTNLSNVD